MVDLTVLILTKNEEKNLKKCVESFKGIASRFVIVDSFSDDKTKELSMELSKEVNLDFYEHKFENYAKQLNWGLENTDITTKWTMRIDADEELTEELAYEMDEKLNNIEEGINGIIVKRRTYFLGKWIKHGGVYPMKVLRIFRTGKAFCEAKIMDEHMILKEGTSVEFKNDIKDFNTKDIDWWTHKHNWYSNREVLDYEENVLYKNKAKGVMEESFSGNQAQRKRFIKNKGYYNLPLFFRAKLYYFYRYYLRLGFLDGKEGKIYHFLQGYWYRFLVDSKIYETTKFNKKIECQGDLK